MRDELLDWYGLSSVQPVLVVPNHHNGGPDPVTNPGTVPVVPEPSKVLLLVISLAVLALRRQR